MYDNDNVPGWVEAFAVFIVWVIGAALIYAAAAFCGWTLNPGEWPGIGRFTTVLLEAAWLYILIDAATDGDKE